MGDDMLRDTPRESINLGLVAREPDIEIHQGSSRQFARTDPVAEGHQRRSPGDTGVAKPAPKAAQPGNADPMDDPTPRTNVVRAEDFARSFGESVPGSARPSPGNPVTRGPVTPEVALFGAQGHRFDFGQLTPVDVGSLENRDDSTPRPVEPSVGATQADITKATGDGISFLGRGPANAWEKKT